MTPIAGSLTVVDTDTPAEAEAEAPKTATKRRTPATRKAPETPAAADPEKDAA